MLDFETVAPGTVYGVPSGHVPGQVVLTQNDIKMSVETFLLGSFEAFNSATVGGRYASAFPTRSLSLDNISVAFDFSGLSFAVTQVSLAFADFGGASNVMVNDGPLHIIDPLSSLTLDVAPGVTANIVNDLLVFTGDTTEIHRVLIGGQELAIDNIVAVPEPAAGCLLMLGAAALMNQRRRSRAAVSRPGAGAHRK